MVEYSGEFLCVYIGKFSCVYYGENFSCVKRHLKTPFGNSFQILPHKIPKIKGKWKLYDFLLYNAVSVLRFLWKYKPLIIVETQHVSKECSIYNGFNG